MPIDKVAVSDRVVKLRAACIDSTVRRKFGRTISSAEAISLAREFDIRSALHQIRQAFEVQIQAMNETKAFEHAVNEVLLGENTDKIVEIRRASQEVASGKAAETKSLGRSDQELWILRQDISKWQEQFSTFLRDLSKLHSMRQKQLEQLHLAPGRLSDASDQLNGLFASAIDRLNALIK